MLKLHSLRDMIRRAFTTSRTTTTPSLAPDSGQQLHIAPARTEEDVKAISRFLSEHVTYDNFAKHPKQARIYHDRIGSTLIGAWADSDLVGAAFIGGDKQAAHEALVNGRDHDARLTLHRVLMIHEIAVKPSHRQHGIATTMLAWIETWAQQRNADIAIAIPMNNASRQLFQHARYAITEPGQAVIYQIKARQFAMMVPTTGDTVWAIKPLQPQRRATVTVRPHPTRTTP